MITALQLKQSQLDQLYDWVDGLPLTRPKKNISRDFSDGILMAQIIQHFYPKIVQMHNYPPGNAYKVKLSNWMTLKNKVLNKLGIHLTQDDCSRLANATPMAIQAVLYEIKKIIDDAILLYENQSSPQKLQYNNLTNNNLSINKINSNQNIKRQDEGQRNSEGKKGRKQGGSSKAEQLRQILNLIKQKISIVEKSVQRKDSQIRQLQQILRQSGQ